MATRREFLQLAAALGVSGLGGVTLSACGEQDNNAEDLEVIIVGAGAAGLSAAYLLSRAGATTTVLEAGSRYGGRMKHNLEFADFPLPMGAEWAYKGIASLERIVDNESVDVDIELKPYPLDEPVGYFDGESFTWDVMGDSSSDIKIVGDTFLTFFETYVIPSITSDMRYDTAVTAISHRDDGVTVTSDDGTSYQADVVIVTVPVQMMKERSIEFDPPLPEEKLAAFDDAFVWGGFKMFIEFGEKFYPAWTDVQGGYSSAGQKGWYDAAWGQDSVMNILGLFTVGDHADRYASLAETELLADVLDELDAIFDGAASPKYIKHITQNWNSEPNIKQAYFADSADSQHPPKMQSPIDDRVFFAGDAYTNGNNWGFVHMAAESARDAVQAILEASTSF